VEHEKLIPPAVLGPSESITRHIGTLPTRIYMYDVTVCVVVLMIRMAKKVSPDTTNTGPGVCFSGHIFVTIQNNVACPKYEISKPD